jgi:hypothetical protein
MIRRHDHVEPRIVGPLDEFDPLAPRRRLRYLETEPKRPTAGSVI